MLLNKLERSNEYYSIEDYTYISDPYKIYQKYKTKWAKQHSICNCEWCIKNSNEYIIKYYFICC